MQHRLNTWILGVAIVAAAVFFSGVCWHAVEEIHYFKTFYPSSLTVQESLYASLVELIKVILIGLPIGLDAVALIWVFKHR